LGKKFEDVIDFGVIVDAVLINGLDKEIVSFL
jgi:hypothetical protein